MSNLLFSETPSVSSKDSFILPRAISVLCYKMDVVQYRMFLAYLQSLEGIFLEMSVAMNKTGNLVLPSQTLAARNLVNSEGLLDWKIIFKNFSSPGYYERLRKSLFQLNEVRFMQPYHDNGRSGMRIFSGLFHIDLSKGEGRQRNNSAVFGIHIDDLDRICSLNLGFHQQAIQFANSAKLSYTARLYSLAKAISPDGKGPVVLGLEDLQIYLGLYEDGQKTLAHAQYNRYCDLKKGVLGPATTELKRLFEMGLSDIWVEIFRKDKLEENQLPTAFVIRIHKQ